MIRKKLIEVFVTTYALTCCISACSQMPVEKEMHHKVVFENEWIRLIDLVVPSGDTTLLHTHSAASVVVFLSESNLSIKDEGQLPVATPVKPGNVVYRNYDEKPVRHAVWSEGNSSFRCLVIEMKHGHGANNCPVLSPDAKLLWQQKLVNAYGLKFRKHNGCSIPACAGPYLLINYSGTISATFSVGKSIIKEGEFVFIPASSKTEINADREAQSILLQLK